MFNTKGKVISVSKRFVGWKAPDGREFRRIELTIDHSNNPEWPSYVTIEVPEKMFATVEALNLRPGDVVSVGLWIGGNKLKISEKSGMEVCSYHSIRLASIQDESEPEHSAYSEEPF